MYYVRSRQMQRRALEAVLTVLLRRLLAEGLILRDRTYVEVIHTPGMAWTLKSAQSRTDHSMAPPWSCRGKVKAKRDDLPD